ncbi:MAG TPA: hypothetical protein VMT69_08610, partial [Kineosporiaceae bacterium]|nr:hypothetical protein [Kineosporiaceae bacterium]
VQEAGRTEMALLGLDGHPTGVRVAMPRYADPPLADGTGNLLFQGVGGLYRADARGLSRVSDGMLLAVGGSAWLTLECDEQARCATVLRSADGRRRGASVALGPQIPYGVISPDGRTVALLIDPGTPGDPGRMGLGLADLTTGARHTVDVALSPSGQVGTVVWSPDSRWLVAVDETGQLTVVDPRRRTTSALVPGAPLVFQLAVRA